MSDAWDAGGPRVTVSHEPRQVRKEATVSGSGCVVSNSTLHPRSVTDDSSVRFMQFEELNKLPLVHGVFSRHGGVSPPPYDSLNLSFSVGDRRENVLENYRIIRQSLKIDHIYCVNQAHRDGIYIVAPNLKSFVPDADSLITDIPYVPLMIKQADCQCIIIYAADKHVLALIHCGWRGNVLNIVGKVIEVLKERFKVHPQEMIATIGPSLGRCCAEYRDWQSLFPEFFWRFRSNNNHFDLKAITKAQLENKGVPSRNIILSPICTSCNTSIFYSNRREKITGRFGTVAYLLDR
jgi:YfiH family protein